MRNIAKIIGIGIFALIAGTMVGPLKSSAGELRNNSEARADREINDRETRTFRVDWTGTNSITVYDGEGNRLFSDSGVGEVIQNRKIIAYRKYSDGIKAYNI